MWWIIAVASICVALLVQYLCSSKILRMKQAISIKSISLRDVRDEGDKLDQQEMELKTQQISLGQSVVRLRKDINGVYSSGFRQRVQRLSNEKKNERDYYHPRSAQTCTQSAISDHPTGCEARRFAAERLWWRCEY